MIAIIATNGAVVANVCENPLRLLNQIPETGFSSLLFLDPLQQKFMEFEFEISANICRRA
jgi:hypothetical protein